MQKNIQLYLISGFLGSGKTSFLRNMLLQNNNVRTGVIVNEFGSIGIDGKVLDNDGLKMVEINNGSIFCACLKDGFVKTLVAFLEQPIDVLFIEASGMADPSSMEHLLEQMDFLATRKGKTNRRYDYRGSVCLIDAGHFLDCCELFTPTQNQVIKSMFLIVNKVDEITEEDLEELHKKLNELNPNAFIYDTTYGNVPNSLIEEIVVPDNFEKESCNTPWNRPETYILDLQGIYDIDSMRKFCRKISEYAFRCKGFFISSNNEIIHIDNVGNDIIMNKIETKNELLPKNKKLVLIGKDSRPYKDKLIKAWQSTFGCETELCFYEE